MKKYLVMGAVAIVALGVFNKFAPASAKSFIYGA